MDTGLLLHYPAVKPKLKRTCSSALAEPTRIPGSNTLYWLLESLLEIPNSSAVALDLSLDHVLQFRPNDSDKDDVIDRAFRLGLALTEAANRSARRRASMHNAVVWALPSDLTIKVIVVVLRRMFKVEHRETLELREFPDSYMYIESRYAEVFSSLDTQNLCKAAAACSFFHKCAADPLCYSNIELTAVVPKVNNMVVSTMIQRAGK